MSFPQNSRVKVRRTNLLIAIIIIVIATTAGVVYAVLNQTVPSTTVPAITVTSTCNALTSSSQLTSSSGAILYSCGTSPAITSTAGTATYTLTGFTQCPATVTVPCYADFGYLSSTDTTDCVSGTTLGAWFHSIAGATNPLTFTAGSWNYCAIYAAPSGGGTLPGFTIAWS